MAPRSEKKRTSLRTKEIRHETQRADASSWSNPSLYVSRARHPLGGGAFIYLSSADRPGVLVPLAVLAGDAFRRRAGVADGASLGRPGLHRCDPLHGGDVGPADAGDRERQSVVAIAAFLHHQSG